MDWNAGVSRLFGDATDYIERRHRSLVISALVCVSIAVAWYNYRSIAGAFATAQANYDARQATSEALESMFEEESSVRGFTSTRDAVYVRSFAVAHGAYERQFTRLRQDLWSIGLRGAESYIIDLQRVHAQWLASVARPLLRDPAGDLAHSRQRTGEVLFSALTQDLAVLNAEVDQSIERSAQTTRLRIVWAIIETALLMTWFGVTVLRMRQYNRRREQRYLVDITEANRTLVSAQRLAGIGNWTKDLDTGDVAWSDEVYRIFDLERQPASEALMRSFDHPDDAGFICAAVADFARTGTQYRIDHRIVLADGTTRFVQEQAEFTCDESGRRRRIVGTLLDVTERKGAEARLAYLAHHDPLTGLPNRALLLERLSHAMAFAERYGRSVAVMFVDLDRFKAINDTLGHSAGDQLLRAVGARLRTVVRTTDTVARSGGDEFIIVLGDIKAAGDLLGVAKGILSSFQEPFEIEGDELYVCCSIGVSVYPRDGDDVESLIKNADTALYRAKEQGRNNIQYYTADLQQEARRKMLLESDLRKGIDRDELLLCYQPIIDLVSGAVLGFEALVRWQHPSRGLVMPTDFIPVAEETGLIVPLGEWVLQRACEQQRAWAAGGYGDRRITVNLSARQFQHRELTTTMRRILDDTGVPEGMLGVEITESLLMNDVDGSAAMLQRLQNMGVSVSIDDFGTGYCSLSYLKHFPVDCLKIDRTFLEETAGDRHNEAISTAIIALARSLEVRVVAEGIETAAQLERLRRLGCHEGQGFLFGAPMPGDACASLLTGEKRWRMEYETA